jgi:hypothetical protein
VGLAQLQFCRVFDGDDPLVFRNEAGQQVQHGGFTGAGTAGYQHVQTAADGGTHHGGELLGQGAV